MGSEMLIQPYDSWHRRRPVNELVTCFMTAFSRAERHEVREQIRREIHQGDHYLVASQGDIVLGFISWRPWLEPRHRLAELVHLGAIRHSGVPGIGRQLIAALETNTHAWYQGHGYSGTRKILLFTHADNRVAQHVYRQAGYTFVKGQDELPVILPEFFREGVDELMMNKDFPEHRLAG